MSSTGEITVDDRLWPLVVVTFQGAPSPSAFSAYLGRMDALLARGQKHGYIVDATEGAMLASEQRTEQGRWLKANRQAIVATSIGTAVIVRYAALRFMLSAIYLVERPVVPTESFTSLDDAYGWLAGVFRKHGLAMPPRARLGA